MTIIDRIHKSGDVEPKTSILIYSKPKLGKTTLCVNTPKVLVIEPDVENGTSAYKTNADVLAVNKWDDFQEVVAYIQANPKKYDWIALDGLTTFVDLAIEKAKTITPPKKDEDIPWNTAINLFKTMFNNFQKLPVNKIYTAHEKERVKLNNTTGDLPNTSEEPRIVIDLPGQLGSYISKNMDLTARLYVEYVSNDVARGAIQLNEPIPSGKRYIRLGACSHTDTGYRSAHVLEDVYPFVRSITIPRLAKLLREGPVQKKTENTPTVETGKETATETPATVA